MITEEICTYEVAKLAKEKGFPAKEIRSWHYEYDGYPTKEIIDERQYPNISQSLLQRWLREENNIDISIYPIFINDTKTYTCDIYAPQLNKPRKSNYFDTYEQALEDALKYSLENLV